MESDRKIDYRTAKQFADANNMAFIETSAKTNVNVTEAFVSISKLILNRPAESKEQKKDKTTQTVNIDKSEKKGQKCAC